MLFTTAVTYKSVYKTYLIIVSGSHDKVKDTVSVLVDFLYIHFNDPGAVPSVTLSEAQIPFSWRYFATNQGKGVADGIGGKAKTLI